MVELFVGSITRQEIRRGSFTSVADLITAIETFIAGLERALSALHLDQDRPPSTGLTANQVQGHYSRDTRRASRPDRSRKAIRFRSAQPSRWAFDVWRAEPVLGVGRGRSAVPVAGSPRFSARSAPRSQVHDGVRGVPQRGPAHKALLAGRIAGWTAWKLPPPARPLCMPERRSRNSCLGVQSLRYMSAPRSSGRI